MTLDTRNRRATIYPYGSTSDGGYIGASYGAARGTFWCRFSVEPGNETVVGAQDEHHESAVLEFDAAVTVAHNDLIVENSVQWKVASVTTRRGSQVRPKKIVRVFRVVDAPAETVP